MTIAIILIVVAAVLILLFVGGFVARRRRTTDWSEHVAQADQHLEAARAADKGWDREVLLGAARQALDSQRAGWAYGDLHLVLVDDKPGVEEDKAHFVAVGGDADVRVVLARDAAGAWRADSVS
jgi:hypothetical protein